MGRDRGSGLVPGPTLRVRQGDRLRVAVENQLDEYTTVHWHGMRVPNAMDGMPHLTQKPIAPGETFTYEFTALDAGTHWYHPHQRGFEQVARGLAGPLIVKERDPPAVDREVTWMLRDWRPTRDAQIADGFGNAMQGRHGWPGRQHRGDQRPHPGKLRVHAGERIRLPLINAASARIFGLESRGMRRRSSPSTGTRSSSTLPGTAVSCSRPRNEWISSWILRESRAGAFG